MEPIVIAIQYPDGRTEQRRLADGSYLLGRDAGDIVLHDPDVSANHARLDVRNGQISVTDLGSTNGTFDVANNRIGSVHPLAKGHFIRLGRSSITLGASAPGATREISTVPDARISSVAPPGPRGELRVRGKRVLRLHGTVIDAQTSGYSATHVSGGGSTTTVGSDGIAHTNHRAVQSYTTHHTVQQLMVRADGGLDHHYELRDCTVGAINGQRVTLITTPQDRPLRIGNEATNMVYSPDIGGVSLAGRVWSHVTPFFGAPFMGLPLFNLLFALGATIEGHHPTKGWAFSSKGVTAVCLAMPLALLVSYGALLPMANERLPGAAQGRPEPVLEVPGWESRVVGFTCGLAALWPATIPIEAALDLRPPPKSAIAMKVLPDESVLIHRGDYLKGFGYRLLIFGWSLSSFLAFAYFQLRVWGTNRMSDALDDLIRE